MKGLLFVCLVSLFVFSPSSYAAATCEQEISIVCPAGKIDGCLTGETRYHRCVPKKKKITIVGKAADLLLSYGFDQNQEKSVSCYTVQVPACDLCPAFRNVTHCDLEAKIAKPQLPLFSNACLAVTCMAGYIPTPIIDANGNESCTCKRR